MATLWQSCVVGLKIFAHWETYVVALGVSVIVVLPKLFLALYLDKNMYGETPFTHRICWYLIRHHAIDRFDTLIKRCSDGSIIRGVKGLLAIGLLEFFGNYWGILTLLLLMLGLQPTASWIEPWTLPFAAPVHFLKIFGALLLGALLVGQVPIIGEALIGPAMVCILAKQVGVAQTYMFPGFWMTVGIVFAGVAIKYLVILILGLAAAFTPTKIVYSPIGGAGKLLMFCLLPLGNFLPAFIYAGWLTQQ